MRRMSASLVGLLLIFFTRPASAQTPQLIEAAKKEGGKAVLYTSMETYGNVYRRRTQKSF